jgi:hypothetical protein
MIRQELYIEKFVMYGKYFERSLEAVVKVLRTISIERIL